MQYSAAPNRESPLPREPAKTLGISQSRTNYCLKALLDKGYIKAVNFNNSNNKRGYLYQLTPHRACCEESCNRALSGAQAGRIQPFGGGDRGIAARGSG